MTAEKASTLRLLKDGMGQPVLVTDTRDADLIHEVRALLPECPDSKHLPILFLLTSLAFLEAQPIARHRRASEDQELQASEFQAEDGWTPADFLTYLRRAEDGFVITLGTVRGRQVETQASLSTLGELKISTYARGRSASRWITFVRGQTHLQEVNSGNS